MTANVTLPVAEELRSLPVQTLTVEVTEGPSAGAVVTADSESLTVGTADGNDLVVADPTVSRYHLELRRRHDGIALTDMGSTNGTFLGSFRVSAGVVPPGTTIRIGRTLLRVREGKAVSLPLYERRELSGILGDSAVMRRLMAQIEKVARSETTALVVGESGSGKELVSHALHELGPRAGKPYVTVDCGSLAPTLVASELFGHERGAFTGAHREHAGAFERASGGTLLLDEIGELPVELQPALLGALERRRFRRVGGQREIGVDVRVVAATNRDLRSDVNSGHFRLDLYYRLAVVTLKVPSLRERPEDIPILVEHFLEDIGRQPDVKALFTPELLTSLQAARWPGNVRELRNFVEATVALGEAATTEPLEPDAAGDSPPPAEGSIDVRPLLSLPYRDAKSSVLRSFEERFVRHWLARTSGNVAQAAREARIDRSYLFDIIRRLGLRTDAG